MRLFSLFFGLTVSAIATEDIPPHPSDNLPSDANLEMEVLSPPPETCKRRARENDLVTVHYTGWLITDSSKFDSSRDRGTPFTFKLGVHQVIAGWDEGVTGACVGEKRRLIIPAGKAYGPRGIPGVIPGGATLAFNVELLSINNNEEL